MYYAHFGLNEAPFSIAPNPAYLFMTERHQEALAHLYHGIESDAGFVLLTGDVGTGKTTVCRRFLHNLPNNTQVAFILNPCVDRIELLQVIAKELNIPHVDDGDTNPVSLRRLTDKLHEYLLENHAKGINTVLLIDEAQQIHPPVLEFIRLLTNLETDKQKLLKIILVGQPELNDLLAQAEFSQLSQRITARYHIYPLNIAEMTDYIAHRLQVAGCLYSQKLFSRSRIKQLFPMSKGIPRIINVICDRALLGAYSSNSDVVTAKLLSRAYHEVRGNYPLVVHRKKRLWSMPFSMFIVASVMLGIVWLLPLLPAINPYHLLAYPANVIENINNEGVIQGVKDVPLINNKNTAVDTQIADEEKMSNEEVFNSLHHSRSLSVPEENLSEANFSEIKNRIIEKQTRIISVVKRYDNKQEAVRDLLSHTIAQPLPELLNNQAQCDRLILLPWRCDEVTMATWHDVVKYNRPAVITLNSNQQEQYLVVVAANKTHVRVATISSSDTDTIEFLDFPIATILNNWSGDFTFIWQAPLGFDRFIYKTSNAVLINWLANAFATIDNQSSLLAKNKYNRLLEKRIRLFQQQHQLKEDGKAGTETLLMLNDALGIAKTLDIDSVDLAHVSVKGD